MTTDPRTPEERAGLQQVGAPWRTAHMDDEDDAAPLYTLDADRLAELVRERDKALAALWRIRMEAARATIDEPVWQLPNTIIHIALGALGKNKHEAQRLAALGEVPDDH